MASNLTSEGAALALDAVLDVGTHLALFTADPTNAGLMTNELANSNGYARQAITWTTSEDDDEENSATITFTASGGDWSEATHWGIVTSGTHGAGDMLLKGPLSTPRTIVDGGSLVYDAADLVAQANLAAT